MSQPVLELHHIGKSFPDVRALRPLTLSIHSGEAVGLLESPWMDIICRVNAPVTYRVYSHIITHKKKSNIPACFEVITNRPSCRHNV